jgi:VWFA-related protein
MQGRRFTLDMQRLVSIVTCAAGIAVLGASPAGRTPQDAQPPAVFRGGVDVVDVDVSVLDRHRLPVRGLKAENFTILEDGQPRPVTAFAEVSLPSRVRPPAAWMADVAPDVEGNDVSREGRLLVILMDRSIGFEHHRDAVRIAEAAVDQLRPGDLAAVAYSTFGIPQNFTSDRARLLAAIRQPAASLPAGDPGSPGECYCGACSLETVSQVAEALLPVRQRRKMLFLIGGNIAIQSTGRCGGTISAERDRAIRALQAANVTVYAFDPTGLPTLLSNASASTPSARPQIANLARRGNLEVLPGHTGGRLVSDPVRAAEQVAGVFRESDAYYVMGFPPTSVGARTRFHEIRVKVDRPDVTVQARRGYYGSNAVDVPRASPKPRKNDKTSPSAPPVSAALQSAIAGLWPRTDVFLSMTAAPIAAPDLRSGTVALVIHVREDLDDGAGGRAALARASWPVDVLAGAFDRNGRALETSTATMTVNRRTPAGGSFDYEVASRLTMPPGRYEIRAAVEDAQLGRTGSVYAYVDVPDFAKAPVSMSGIVIEADPPRVPQASSAFSDLVPVRPTAQRAFAATDRVVAFTRIYQGLSRAMMPGYVVAEIRDDRDTSVFRSESRVLPSQFGASRGMDFSVDLPVARLGPGEYVLAIEARHGNEHARRDVRFSIQ